MNRILDFIGNHIRIVGLVLLGGFLATAAAGYWGVPSLTGNTQRNGAVAQAGLCSHDDATAPAAAGAVHGCAHDQAPAPGSCCPQPSTRPQPTAARCPAMSQAVGTARASQPETEIHAR
jgi:hypothetical protein